MVVRANGILHGDRIDLETPVTVLPDGSKVALTLCPRVLSDADRHRLIDELSGTWAGDNTISAVFDELAYERRRSSGRTISFDDTP